MGVMKHGLLCRFRLFRIAPLTILIFLIRNKSIILQLSKFKSSVYDDRIDKCLLLCRKIRKWWNFIEWKIYRLLNEKKSSILFRLGPSDGTSYNLIFSYFCLCQVLLRFQGSRLESLLDVIKFLSEGSLSMRHMLLLWSV